MLCQHCLPLIAVVGLDETAQTRVTELAQLTYVVGGISVCEIILLSCVHVRVTTSSSIHIA